MLYVKLGFMMPVASVCFLHLPYLYCYIHNLSASGLRLTADSLVYKKVSLEVNTEKRK
jgi:hypothetical protein